MGHITAFTFTQIPLDDPGLRLCETNDVLQVEQDARDAQPAQLLMHGSHVPLAFVVAVPK